MKKKEDIQIDVRDASGKLVFSQTIKAKDANQGWSLDLSELGSGKFMACITTGNDQKQIQLVK